MRLDDAAVRSLYDRSVRVPLLWELDALVCRATENSVYRKRAIARLGLAGDSVVLDAACGTGLNFRILESYLSDKGRLVGVDLSPGVLKVAEARVKKHGWSNVELVNVNLVDYEPGFLFDGVICTLALTIIPRYEAAVNKMFRLLRPGGRLAILGMKQSGQQPYRALNPIMTWASKLGGADLRRDVAGLVRSMCRDVEYEECFGGWYYVLSASRSNYVGDAR